MLKHFTCTKTNQRVILKQLIASSGEGEVWRTENPAVLAKVYHTPTLQRQEKLKVMVKYPPSDPNRHRHCISFAWPQSLLTDHYDMVVGFLMPAIHDAKELIDVYNPSRRKKQGLMVDWYFLHTAAHNIASIIHAIHETNYVLGDIKPQNILINNQAIPSIIDTDSFQVTNPQNGQIYRCLVGSEGFTPPELLGKDFALLNQTEVHDRFRLGIIIYYLLFGSHPFQGQWAGTGDSPELSDLIRQGHWVFGTRSLIRPSRLTISLSTVHPALKDSFMKCFNEGYQNPELRPSAKQWQDSLRLAISTLKVCNQTKNHYYYQDNLSCYWCDRAMNLKTDIFGKAVRPLVPSSNLSPTPKLVASVPTVASISQAHLARMSYARANYQMFLRRQAFLRQKFNRHTFMIVGNLSLLGSILASFFLVQEFPNPSHSILSDKPTFKEPEISPRENASIYNQPGYIRYAQGNVLGTISDFDRSIKLNPILAKTYYNQRMANDNLEYEQSVKQDWNRALSLNSQELENDDNSFKSDKNKKFDQLAVLSSPLIDTIESPSALSSSLSSEIESISIPLKVPQKDMSFLPKPKRLTIPEDFPQKSDQLAHRSIFIRPPNKIINKPPLDTLTNPSVLEKKIQTNTSRKTEADGINNQQVNLNLALSFYQQGIFYKNLGINSEAIRNLEEASLLLQKYGQKNGNQDIAKEVETIIRNLRKENSSS